MSTENNDRINKLKRAFAYNLFYEQGKTTRTACLNDYYLAVAHTVRDRMQHLFINSMEALLDKETKVVCYLSAEFLMGPHLVNNLICLDLYDDVVKAAKETGLDLQAIIDHEEEPGLGNGGLGGWRPVIWTPWPPYRFRPLDTGFDMNSVCLIRKSKMVGKKKSATRG